MHPVIRPALLQDVPELGRMRAALWPDASATGHAIEARAALTGQNGGTLPLAIFVAEAGENSLVGFVEVGLRSHADGCDPDHAVGFVEGWFVEEPLRGQGVGRRLIAAAEDWARQHGCREMASDTWIDNEPSQRAHEALGYEVVDRCVNYRKAL